VAGYFLGVVLLRRFGTRTARELPGSRRAVANLILITFIAAGLLAAWAITHSHTALGVGVLIVVFVLPEFVLIPLHLKQSRRKVSATETRRCERDDK
jgi:hypothetical protein